MSKEIGSDSLKEELKGPLLALGRLRNEFAHRLDAALTEARVDGFYKTFGGDDKQSIHQAFNRTRKSLGVPSKKRMKQLSPQDRFILYAVSLRAVLLVAIEEVSAASAPTQSEPSQWKPDSEYKTTGCSSAR